MIGATNLMKHYRIKKKKDSKSAFFSKAVTNIQRKKIPLRFFTKIHPIPRDSFKAPEIIRLS